jgi:hypothetical protein
MTKLVLIMNAAVLALAFTAGDVAWYILHKEERAPVVSISAIAAIIMMVLSLWEYTS